MVHSGCNQYHIQTPTRHFLFVKQDLDFNTWIVGLDCHIPKVNNFLGSKTADKTLIFSFLLSETENLTGFAYSYMKPTITPVFDIFAIQNATHFLNN